MHGEDLLDWLSIAAVQRILAEASVDIGDLVDIAEPATEDDGQHGAA